jgi:hypothetical protein
MDKKISYFKTKEDFSKLVQIVTKWRIMIGLSKEMSEEELKINVQFIRENFNALTLKEIDLAINLSLRGDLGVDVEPYGNFSPLYISRILNGYLRKCEEQINKLIQRKKTLDRNVEEPKLSYEEELKQRIEYIKNYARWVREKEKYYGDFNHIIWDFLNNNNLIDPSDEILNEAKEFADEEIKRDNDSMGLEKLLRTMGNKDREFEKKKRQEMYGRFFVMRKFWRSIKDLDKFFNQFKPQQYLEKKNG